MKYIVEHMEQGFSPWVRLEYLSMVKEIGVDLVLSSVDPSISVPEEIKELALVTSQDITQLKSVVPTFEKSRVCLLDPSAETLLAPEDAEKFEFFLFGGILGDHPPQDRTGQLRQLGFEGRNLGKIQMTTDSAVRVAHKILEEKKNFEEIPFVDFPELQFNKYESTEMPFRYIKGDNGPVMPEGMFELIKKDSEKSLDDLL